MAMAVATADLKKSIDDGSTNKGVRRGGWMFNNSNKGEKKGAESNQIAT